jgi:Mg2+ and Co2+ transporter CorA
LTTTAQLTNILSTRSEESSLQTSRATQQSLALNQKDSQVLKLFSIIATIYLPASLVAVSQK